MTIFELPKIWLREGKYSLVAPICRSSRSVGDNFVEAWGKRRYEARFISKLSDADGECTETRASLDFALRCEYITATTFNELDAQYDEISGRLVKMVAAPEKWCGPSGLVQGEVTEYAVASDLRIAHSPRHPLSHDFAKVSTKRT